MWHIVGGVWHRVRGVWLRVGGVWLRAGEVWDRAGGGCTGCAKCSCPLYSCGDLIIPTGTALGLHNSRG